MAIALLVRHGHSTGNAGGVLSGRMPGVELTDRGRSEVAALGAALAGVPLVRLVASPLERCQQTASAIAAARGSGLAVETDERLTEAGYGAWTGRPLKELAGEALWKTVQAQPSAARFPEDGAYAAESLTDMATRIVGAVRALDAEVEAAHGADAVWVAVTHGDLVKAVVADASGVHLDQFQRFVVETASVAAVRYTAYRPFLLGINADPTRLGSLTASSGHASDGEATPGGSADGQPATAG
ncbi:MAG: MSMEG_4193 family putative phosphomutase [Nostocoides sp.]